MRRNKHVRTCARSAVPCVALAPARCCCPPLIACAPAQRGAGAAVPARSGPCGAAPAPLQSLSTPIHTPPQPGLAGGPSESRGGGAGGTAGPGEGRGSGQKGGIAGGRDAGGGVSVTGGRREGGGRWGCVPAGLQRRGESPWGPRHACPGLGVHSLGTPSLEQSGDVRVQRHLARPVRSAAVGDACEAG